MRIKINKSELIPVENVEYIDNSASKFVYRVGSLPSSYLGLHLGTPFKSMVWIGGEVLQKVSHVEDTIHFQRSENYLDLKYFV